MRGRPHESNEFVNDKPEEEVHKRRYDNNHILNGLFHVNIRKIATACSLDGVIGKRIDKMSAAVALHDLGAAAGCSCAGCVGGDVEAIAVVGVRGDVDGA